MARAPAGPEFVSATPDTGPERPLAPPGADRVSGPVDGPDEYAELRRLLVGPEQRRLDELGDRLDALRPDADEIVVVWCARTVTSRTFGPAEIENMGRKVDWRMRKGR